MNIRRSLPPTAAPLAWGALGSALAGACSGRRAVRRLEDEIRSHFGVRHVFLVSSGKAALTLILRALHTLSGRAEVVIPAYTCFSVPSAIVKAGLTVRLCDLEPSGFDLDVEELDQRVTADTLCVVPTHLFGAPSRVDRIAAIARARGAFVVEDAAQAMGGVYRGRPLGTWGDAAFFSLGRGKNLTCGAGGIVVTQSDEIGTAIARLHAGLEAPSAGETIREFLALLAMTIFIQPWLYWLPEGIPFLRLGETRFYRDFPIKTFSGLKAGYLRRWRRRLEAATRTRRGLSDYWRRHVGTEGASARSYLRFPVLCESREARDRLYATSRRLGLGLSLMYPAPIHEIDALRGQFDGQRFPRARAVVDRLVMLPTHGWVTERDRRAITALLASHACSPNGPMNEAAPAAVGSGHGGLG